MEDTKPPKYPGHLISSDLINSLAANKEIRSNSSANNPQLKLINYQLHKNNRLKHTPNVSITPSICRECKKPRLHSNSFDTTSHCECSKTINFPKKRVKSKNPQMNSLNTHKNTLVLTSKKITSFPLKSRNLSTLHTKTPTDLRIMKNLKSVESLIDTANVQGIMLMEKVRKKDDAVKYKFLVYKGNNSELVKRVMENRNSWCEGYYSLPSSANFIWMPTSHGIRFERLKPSCSIQYVNHFEHHGEISNKSKLFNNLTAFCLNSKASLTSIVPTTFVIDFRNGNYSSQIHNFKVYMINIKLKNLPSTHYTGKNIWIMKPAGFNRGRGINVFNDFDVLDEFVKEIVSNKLPGSAHVYVIQKYIEKPLLIYNRKFDIRVWVLVAQNENCYFFPQGYLRTSSEKFTLDHLESKFVHLTNNAIQKDGAEYGKFEAGNQMSFKQFQEYLQANYGNIRLGNIISVMKSQIITSLMSVKGKLNPNSRQNCFEIFGYDFIIDSSFKPWLIEVNTNPCLELSSPLLEQIIPKMLDDALELTVDTSFPSSRISLKTPNVLDLPSSNMWEFLVSLSASPCLLISGFNL